jgi:hypothetical protein
VSEVGDKTVGNIDTGMRQLAQRRPGRDARRRPIESFYEIGLQASTRIVLA